MSALLLLLANAAFIYKSFDQFDGQKNLVTHTYEVIGALEGIVSEVKDVQSAQRGYVITGHADYLTPYNIALPKVGEYFTQLESLLADNAKQLALLKKLKRETDHRLAIAAEIIAVYDSQGQQKAFALVKKGMGKKEMDLIRATASEMIAEERDLLGHRQRAVDEAAAVTLWLGGIGLSLALIILGLVYRFINWEHAKREQAETELQMAFSEIKAAAEEDRLINQMTEYLQGCGTAEEAYGIIERSLPHILPDTSGGIFIFNSGRNLLEGAVSWGRRPHEKEFDAEKCWALRRGQMHRIHPDSVEPVCDHVGHCPAGGAICFPMQAHGQTLGLFFVASDSPLKLGAGLQKAVRRISEQISLAISNLNLRRSLKDQSIRDPMTGLFNRRYLEETMEREMARARRNNQPLCILVLDIDHFKKYNDSYGHDAGDALLVQFAKLLQEKTRKEDIACRYGGEEFVLVLPASPLENAVQRANDICAAVRNMTVHAGNDTLNSITVSIGVSAYPAHGETSAELVTKADHALYQAKRNGRDQVRVA